RRMRVLAELVRILLADDRVARQRRFEMGADDRLRREIRHRDRALVLLLERVGGHQSLLDGTTDPRRGPYRIRRHAKLSGPLAHAFPPDRFIDERDSRCVDGRTDPW